MAAVVPHNLEGGGDSKARKAFNTKEIGSGAINKSAIAVDFRTLNRTQRINRTRKIVGKMICAGRGTVLFNFRPQPGQGKLSPSQVGTSEGEILTLQDGQVRSYRDTASVI